MATARVLIVDDDDLFLDATSRMLSRAGYEVLPANRPHQALEIIRNNPPIDLVISDVAMPEMRGTELIREIARIRPGTASLLFTGGPTDPAEVPEGVPLLRKPLPTAELISAANAVLERSTQIAADLAHTRQESAELRVQSQRLISKSQNLRVQRERHQNKDTNGPRTKRGKNTP